MKLVSFCIKHRVTTIMACVIVAIFGFMGFTKLPLALMPDIELPMAVVFSTYTGAGPQEVENLLTRTLESACASVSGMEDLQSISSEGSSIVMVTFADGTNMDNALVDLREKIDMVKSYLPDDASAPTVMAINVDAMPVMQIALKGTALPSLQTIAEDTLSPALERIDGVASVDILGGYANEIAVETYSEKLSGYGLSISYITQILTAENLALPAGSVDNGTQTLTVRTDGEFSSIDDVKNCLLPLPSGGTVRLDEVANVYLKPQEQSIIAKVDGEPCIILSVNKQSGVNTVQTAQRVQKTLNQLTKENPTLNWMVLMDQSDFINLAVNSAITNIILGVLLAAVVLFVFLRDWGATLVISLAMPLCIVAVFLIMQVLGITMNMMSLGGVAMGVGMIVDNSIVVLENIFHYRADGFNSFEACTKGTGEVALSISASTLTTVAVFLPLGLTGGLVGMMFYDFCLTICALMLTSLVVSLTIVPLFSYALLGRGSKNLQTMAQAIEDAGERKPMARARMTAWYQDRLRFFVTHRKIAVLTSLALVAAFSLSIFFAGFEMIPDIDQSSISISVSLPVGAEVKEAQRISEQVVAVAIDTVPELDSIYYTTGSGMMSSLTGGGGASVSMNLVSRRERDRSAEEIAQQLRQDLSGIAGAELSVSSAGMMDMSSMTGSAVAITLTGSDNALLKETADRLVREITALPDAVEVTSSASEQVPAVNVTLNRDVASQYGLNAATVGSAVRSQLTGTTATELKIGGEEISVVVRGDSDAGNSLDALRSMPIATPLGSSIPLSMIADVSVELSPQSIYRENQSRTITVSGSSATGDTVGIYNTVSALLEDFQTPEGIQVSMGGENEEMIEAFLDLGYALLVAVGLVYFVLASQFESFLMPVIVMMILPVGLIGSLFLLPFFGMKVSMLAFVGVIMLSGVVVNSSIVLVDYIKIRRSRGEEKEEAILNACPRRVRPVLMTTLTTVLGLLPMAFGVGEGSEIMMPMAIVMITGMVVSTVVTLLFTPVYYSLLDSLDTRLRRKRLKREEAAACQA